MQKPKKVEIGGGSEDFKRYFTGYNQACLDFDRHLKRLEEKHKNEIREAKIELTERIRENAVDSNAGSIWINALLTNLKSRRNKS